jgi:hypothetical protein
MKIMLSELTVLGLKQQPPSVKGWLISINALLLLWEDLSSSGVKYLCTRKISQDCLENCFSVIRSNGANGSHAITPDVQHFIDGYKHVLIKSCLTNSKLSNCESDYNELLVDILASQPDPRPEPPAAAIVEDKEVKEVTNPPSVQPAPSLAQASITCYVAGYVCHKYLKKHKCGECADILLGRCADLPARSTLLTRLRAYSASLADSGALCVPSKGMLAFIESCEALFLSTFENIKQMPQVMTRLVNMMKNSIDLSFFADAPCSSIINDITTMFVKVRVLYALKFQSRGLGKRGNKRARRALILSKE